MNSSEMPPGVEHGLSGRVGQKANVFVNPSEMPPGVEHVGWRGVDTGNLRVNSYEMPQGVEHGFLPGELTPDKAASSYEMPQGVEHRRTLAAKELGWSRIHVRCRKALSTPWLGLPAAGQSREFL